MKKKLGFKFGVVFTLVALVAALVSVLIINTKSNESKERSYAALHESESGRVVSAKFGGEALFSAEKVLVTANPIDNNYDAGDHAFAYNDEGGKYHFSDYYGSNKKAVVEDGKFVKLDNKIDGSGKYVNKENKSAGAALAQDAIMVSLGHYTLDADEEIVQTGTLNSGITKLQISANYNGKEVDSLKNLTAHSVSAEGGPYFDFALLMTQDKFNEGRYTFTFEYMKNGEVHNAQFTFNLIFDTSYTQVLDPSSDMGYQAQPVLGWLGDTAVFNKRGKEAANAKYIRYYDGINGVHSKTSGVTFDTDEPSQPMSSIAYPTLTFDYIKYRMSYTHTYDRVTTTYTYSTSTTNGFELVITATNVNGTTIRRETMKYYEKDTLNLVTIMFTKPGEYVFSFDYLYNGVVPTGVEFGSDLKDVKLLIHGLEMKYSKVDYNAATLRHFVLSADASKKVDLVVANGVKYNEENKANSKDLDLIYSLDGTSTERIGNVITSFDASTNADGSRDALINAQLATSGKSNNVGASVDGANNDYVYLTKTIDIKNTANRTNSRLSNLLGSINYVKTNQGSFWFDANDKYDETNSFYYYSVNKPSLQEVPEYDENNNATGVKYSAFFKSDDTGSNWQTNAKSFTNQTSFNQIGYYLVFMKLEPLYSGDQYYQIFAFQYSADSVDIKIVESGANGIATNIPISNYTNKNVNVSWVEPDVFEKKLTASYYVSYNNNVEKEQLLNQRAISLGNGDQIGHDVAQGQFAKILIKIENNAKSASYRIFTIDRADIANVYAYVVKKSTTPTGEVVYSIDAKQDGTKKVLTTGITDSYVSLNWQEENEGRKNSGANITAEYYYTPFTKNSKTISKNANYGWISTNYEVGSELGPFPDYIRPTSASQVRSSGIFSKQGIYRVVLTDEAGNQCQYVFVIDNTEAYYQVVNGPDTTFNTEASLIFSTDTTYSVGTAKNIPLNGLSSEIGTIINALMTRNNAVLKENKYYMLDSAYNYNLGNLFKQDGTATNLVVANTSISAYDINGVSMPQAVSGLGGTITADLSRYSTSTVIKLYLFAYNNECSSLPQGENSNSSYLTIEVNDDNSRGNVYFYNQDFSETELKNNVPIESEPSNEDETVFRLYTGEDETDGAGAIIPASGIQGAQATSAEHAVFIWNMGEGDTVVSQVSYTRHELTTNYDSNASDGMYYFYNQTPIDSGDIYKNNTFQSYAFRNGNMGYYCFDAGNSKTSDGLYIVTRTYAKDGAEKKYYFIVDRKDIIETTTVDDKKSINIKLLEEETPVTNFTRADGKLFVEHQSAITNSVAKLYNYSIQLTTNKVPATMHVPVGKITDGTCSKDRTKFSNYQAAGRLTATLYYSESLTSGAQIVYKGAIKGEDAYEYSGPAFYSFDVYTYLSDVNTALRDKIIKTGVEGNWICAPGIYCLVIEDNVVNINLKDLENNKKIIGFEIVQDKYPEVEFTSGYKTDAMDEMIIENDGNGTFNVVTNEEYIQFILPTYVTTRTYAQVDPGYLDVKVSLKREGESVAATQQYLKFTNGNSALSGDLRFTDREGNQIERFIRDGGALIANLNTRFTLDNIAYEQSDQIIYTIKIRYKLGVGEKYIACYDKYYESTYIVEIDRLAPGEDIKMLTTRDAEFIKYYNEDLGVEEMFENAEYVINPAYTKQYSAYYQDGAAEKDMSKIYVFNVNPETPIALETGMKVRYRSLDYVSGKYRNLSLPILNINEYRLATGLEANPKFAAMLGSNYGLYEIIEIDKAGNVTQYVVNYTNSYSAFEVKFNVDNVVVNNSNILTLASEQTQKPIAVFKVDATSGETFTNSKFFRIEVIDGVGNISYMNTNLLTSLNGKFDVSTYFAKYFERKGAGGYTIKIINPYSRDGISTTSFTLNIYEENNSIRLNIDSLIINNAGNYYINLSGANRQVQGLWYYATEIQINETKYILAEMDIEETIPTKVFTYKEEVTGVEIADNIITLSPGVYKVTMTDFSDNKYAKRFSTTGTDDFYSIKAPEGYNLFKDGDIYYAYNTVTVNYAASVFTDVEVTYRLNGIGRDLVPLRNKIDPKFDFTGEDVVEVREGQIIIQPKFGYTLEVNIEFEEDEYYYVVIEGRTGEVELVEYLTGNEQNVISTWRNDQTKNPTNNYTTGRMSLLLNKEDNANFNNAYSYVYKLRQEGKEEKILTGEYESIITDIKDSDKYLLVIEVLAKDGTYLGQINNEFYVKASLSELFSVYVFDFDEDGNEINTRHIKPSATFTANQAVGLAYDADLLSVNIPLYIVNSNYLETAETQARYGILKDVASMYIKDGATGLDYQVYKPTSLYEMRFYTLDAGTYRVGFGIMFVQSTDELVKDLVISYGEKLEKTIKITSEDKDVIVPTENSNRITMSGKALLIGNDLIIKKNLLKVNVYFEDKFVKTIEFSELGTLGEFSFELFGNGAFSYVIYDMAGNVQRFSNLIAIDGRDLLTTENKDVEEFESEVYAIEVVQLREVVVKVKTVSDKEEYIPLDNAFYSDQVELRLYSSYLYQNGSISVTATRNGQPYSFEQTAPYLFADYGTYKVKITAVYSLEGKKTLELSKNIAFTIINEKEARKSMDMTGINGCNITKVLNNFEQDVTNDFISKVLAGGSYVSYDKIKEFAQEMQTTHGKNKFTIFYEYNDGIYPKRELSFAFTLNDEIPEIDCSIEKGEKTNKGFEISFNAGIIYEQIGEAYIYINDTIVAEINAESSYDIQKISTTFKEHGAGDYYVQLITASGNVLSSYKVIITEPLNVWAIVIIVVAVVVVGTVTTVIIVLRHKMKIR